MTEKRWLTKEQKRLLKPHAEHYSAMYGHTANSTDDALAELLVACCNCTTSNCWWAEYEAAQHLISRIKEEMRWRAGNAAREAEPHRQADEIRWADDGGRQAA